jgi:hypothetical protein
VFESFYLLYFPLLLRYLYTVHAGSMSNYDTLIKNKIKFFSYIINSDGSGCKVIYEEMRKYLVIYEVAVAVSHNMILQPLPLDFLIYEENFVFFFSNVLKIIPKGDGCRYAFGWRIDTFYLLQTALR